MGQDQLFGGGKRPLLASRSRCKGQIQFLICSGSGIDVLQIPLVYYAL